MRGRLNGAGWGLLCLMLAWPVWGQSLPDQPSASQSPGSEPAAADQNSSRQEKEKKGPGAAKEMGKGAGDIGIGAAKGTGSLAKGTAKGAGDLVTLHPIDAAGNVGKGAASAGKDVSVGTAKGTGKIAKGIGKAFKKLF